MKKTELIEQTKNAFDFVQKLYLEVSYLIKEIEGLLAEEEEHFIIGRPNGYSINSRSSNGLEPVYVNLWLLRKMGVFYIPEEGTEPYHGQTITKLVPKTKLIYMRIILDDPNLEEPVVHAGVLHSFQKKNQANNKLVKFEQLMNNIESNENKIFANLPVIDYEDANVKYKGQLFTVDLYDINSSKDISELIIKPCLEMFRAIKV